MRDKYKLSESLLFSVTALVLYSPSSPPDSQKWAINSPNGLYNSKIVATTPLVQSNRECLRSLIYRLVAHLFSSAACTLNTARGRSPSPLFFMIYARDLENGARTVDSSGTGRECLPDLAGGQSTLINAWSERDRVAAARANFCEMYRPKKRLRGTQPCNEISIAQRIYTHLR